MITDLSLIEEFVSESAEHITETEQLLLALETSSEDESSGIITTLFRGVHSIKGAAGFLALTNISELSHRMETLLSSMRDKEIEPQPEYIDLLLEGVDLLKQMIDDVAKSESIDITDINSRLDTVNGSDGKPDANVETECAVLLFDQKQLETAIESLSGNFLYQLSYSDPLTLEVEKELEMLGQIIERKQVEDSTILLYSTVLDIDMIHDASDLDESSVIKVTGDTDTISNHASGDEQKCDVQVSKDIPQKDCKPAMVLDGEDTDKQPVPPANSKQNTIRVNVDVLDELMLLAGELVLVRNQHMQWVDQNDSVGSVISQRLNSVTSDLQNSIMQVRMQPVGGALNKLPRITRDLSRKLSKQVRLDIVGDDVEVDKTILESLADPLTHMIRNCCDHGLETPDDRLAMGKNPTGTIAVSAKSDVGQVIIEITDDGAGIDPERIRKKVIESGLRSSGELNEMSDKQIVELITAPGFSTAESVSDVSGRGVGMDVVRSSIESLGGTLNIDSKLGHGTTMSLSLPQTMSVMNSLIIGCRDMKYAIPQSNIEEIVTVADESVDGFIEIIDNQEVCRYYDQLLQVVRLSDVFDNPEPFTDTTRSEIIRQKVNTPGAGGGVRSYRDLNMAIVQLSGKRYALIVDEVYGAEEIVVKPMHQSQKKLNCYMGVTVLGDGKVAPILNVDGIASHALDGVHNEISGAKDLSEFVARSDDAQKVLLFESGIHEQFALSLALIKRIDLVSLSDIQKIGDKSYMTVDDTPTQIITMDNAYSVSECICKDEMFLLLPKHVRKPIGILVSEINGICTTLTSFDSETAIEDGILGTALIDERLTVFPDIYRMIEKVEPKWFEENQRSKIKNDGVKVLLVEDTPFFRQLVRNYLESDNYSVESAENGQVALEKARENQFDLILSDLEMPVMNGWDFARNIRSDSGFEPVPLVALTSLDSEHDKRCALDAGFDDYLIKIERENFLNRISEFITTNKCGGA